jgi:release factor glutamine methyltransferase
MELFYEPQEDSALLADAILHKLDTSFIPKTALDVGTGSGFLAKAMQITFPSCDVLGIDINEAALAHCESLGLRVLKSNLFENIPKSQKFDLIVCNPPYLPQNDLDDMSDIYTHALVGGKKGYEYILRFLDEAKKHLAKGGKILLLFSNLSNKNVIDKYLKDSFYVVRELAKQNVGLMEDLYVYGLTIPDICFDFAPAKYIAKGKRGLVISCTYKHKKVVAKIPLDETQRVKILEKEAKFLQLANSVGVGPKYMLHTDQYLLMEYIHGIHLRDYLKTATKVQAKSILNQIQKQCEQLDKLGVTKQEMTNPGKNILVTKDEKTKKHHPVLIDFERATFTTKSKNVNQFAEFVKRLG